MSQGPVLGATLYSVYINDNPQTPGVHLALFTDNICIYERDRKEGYVLRKLQSDPTLTELWCDQ